MKLIAKALIEAQREMGNAIKDSKNPFFKSAYADLNSVKDACIPAFNKYGIGVCQPVIQKDGKSYVRTMLIHESGETNETMGIPSCDVEILFFKPNDAQGQGSGITYARRYGLQSMANIGAEDDDGNKAVEEPKKQKGNQFSGLAEAADKDMKATQRAANETDFRRIKLLLETAETEEELNVISKNETKTINKLAKYAPDLFGLLKDCKTEMLRSFTMKEELGDNIDYSIAG